MFDAARDGNTELLSAALDAGLPPNLTNAQGLSLSLSHSISFQFDLRLRSLIIGNTLLMLAAYAGHAPLVSLLLEKGADGNKPNDKGQAPLAGAVFKGHDAVVRVLAAAGADPRAGQPNAIQSARMFKRDHLLEVLGAREAEGMDVPPGVGPPV